ncbi:growth arrest-specific protein 1-like [Hemicordylus capensis]|uniref:growth arrest-specific protein 1-like n=1 Tax=Hemicordylus capensis TaxID=884348 RepID=UPI0023041996|nr:growth arrest-specific protein 1-like [Hemicordylus capensis]
MVVKYSIVPNGTQSSQPDGAFEQLDGSALLWSVQAGEEADELAGGFALEICRPRTASGHPGVGKGRGAALALPNGSEGGPARQQNHPEICGDEEDTDAVAPLPERAAAPRLESELGVHGTRGLARAMWRWLLLLLLSPLLLARAQQQAAGEPCWEALLRCQDEPDCGSAYSQSQAACQPVLGGEQQESPAGGAPPLCPSHCIGALVRLNRSRSGPALERCECGQDARCRRLKAALEPCLPRPSRSGLGCTAARFRCQQEPACQAPLAAYLARCGQLFNGRRCTGACRTAIGHLLAAPGGPALERCVCDGTERPFCQVLKANMGRLCFGPAPGSPSVEAEEDDEADEYADEEGALPDGGAWLRSDGPPWRPKTRRALALRALPVVALLWLIWG